MDQIAKFCDNCSLARNIKKIKVMVCKKGGKHEKNERCHMEEVNEVVYREVKLESTGSKKQGSWRLEIQLWEPSTDA
jgi:hypothetical protein